jgi:hypothetical protein
MANPFGRTGRRRRVLNEEIISASSSHQALRTLSTDDKSSPAHRYSEAAGVENHPQVTDFVPRRYRSIIMLALVGALSTAGIVALDRFIVPIVHAYGARLAEPITLGAPGNLASWLSAVLLLLAAALCWLTYSLRRHRIDDYRGRYRIWLAAAAACLLLSVNSITSLHQLLAAAAAHHTGWTALADNAIWWLLLGGIPLAWITVRIWLDARESRLAVAALTVALLSYAAGLLVVYARLLNLDLETERVFVAAATLLGHWWLVIGLVANCRFVVLDAQGLVPVRRSSRIRQHAKSVQAGSAADQQLAGSRRAAENRARLAAPRLATPKLDESQWTDGSKPDDDAYGDDSNPRNRKLSKAERKQLRKLKARNRAA